MWSSILPGVAAAAVLSVLAWAARRGQPTSDPDEERLLFTHGAILRWFSYSFAIGTPILITAFAIVRPPANPGDRMALIALYAVFMLLSAPLVWETARFALAVTPDGIDFRSPWRSRRFYRWEEITTVSFSLVNQWFIVHTTSAGKFRIHTLVPGLTHFLECLEERLPPEAFVKAKWGYDRVGRALPS